jgi:hypothetical protein
VAVEIPNWIEDQNLNPELNAVKPFYLGWNMCDAAMPYTLYDQPCRTARNQLLAQARKELQALSSSYAQRVHAPAVPQLAAGPAEAAGASQSFKQVPLRGTPPGVRHAIVDARANDCKDGVWCEGTWCSKTEKLVKCKLYHTDATRKLWENPPPNMRPGFRFAIHWKTKLCKSLEKNEKCRYTLCPFAHDENELHCTFCKGSGHAFGACPAKRTFVAKKRSHKYSLWK